MRPLVLILPKMNGYVKTFKNNDGDKNKNNKQMYLRIDDDKLLEEYRTSQTKIEDLKNIELNALPVNHSRYIKNKRGTHGDKVYTNF